jgi:hypothetical protein
MSSFRILIFFTKDRNNGNIWPHRMCEPIYCQAGGGEQEEANSRRRRKRLLKLIQPLELDQIPLWVCPCYLPIRCE